MVAFIRTEVTRGKRGCDLAKSPEELVFLLTAVPVLVVAQQLPLESAQGIADARSDLRKPVGPEHHERDNQQYQQQPDVSSAHPSTIRHAQRSTGTAGGEVIATMASSRSEVC